MGTSASSTSRYPSVVTTNEEYNNALFIKAAKNNNRDIDKLLEKDKINEAQKVKLLLLGGGESGKSTFAKQMRILHLNGFSESELNSYRRLVFANTATCLHQLLQGIHQLKIGLDGLHEYDLTNFRLLKHRSPDFDYEMTPAIGAVMKRIWSSETAKSAYRRRNEFELLDSCKYFLDNIDRISTPGYIPTPSDIVRTRASTMGIYEISFQFKGKQFKLVDVGGQRTERRKWIHCFDNVTAIMFITSLIEYDQYLKEDSITNRLDDSLALFGSITKNSYFKETAILLFLNKKDILKEKVQTSPFTLWRSDYTGPQTYQAIREYILMEFTKQKPPNKACYSYFTEATDTKNIEVVFSASMDIILSKALASIGVS